MLCNCMVFLIFAMIDTHAHSVMNQKNLMVKVKVVSPIEYNNYNIMHVKLTYLNTLVNYYADSRDTDESDDCTVHEFKRESGPGKMNDTVEVPRRLSCH